MEEEVGDSDGHVNNPVPPAPAPAPARQCPPQHRNDLVLPPQYRRIQLPLVPADLLQRSASLHDFSSSPPPPLYFPPPPTAPVQNKRLKRAASKHDRGGKGLRSNHMDLIPVEVIGSILSRLGSARLVAQASATCRKWREAAEAHLHTICFHESDFYRRTLSSTIPTPDQYISSRHDFIITNAVMRAEQLHDLTISLSMASPLHQQIFLGAAVVIAVLQHTKRTLKSLTLSAPIYPRVNIWDTLGLHGGSDLKLERLHVACASTTPIPLTLTYLTSRVYGCIPSLVSLTLDHSNTNFFQFDDFCLLFVVFPKLESLSLLNTHVLDAPSVVEIRPSSPLKALSLDCLTWRSKDDVYFYGVSNTVRLVVHGGHQLESISIRGTKHVTALDCGDEAGNLNLRSLSISETELDQVFLPESLQVLQLWNAKIDQLETGSLSSLSELTLMRNGYSRQVLQWPSYEQVMEAITGTLYIGFAHGIRKLRVLGDIIGSGGADQKDIILDANMMVSNFPSLHTLSLSFQHTFFCNRYHSSSTLTQSEHEQQPEAAVILHEKLEVLELHCLILPESSSHELFVQWVIKFLSCCPRLKRLVLVLTWCEQRFDSHYMTSLANCRCEVPNLLVAVPSSAMYFVAQMASLLATCMQAFPLVDAQYRFIYG